MIVTVSDAKGIQQYNIPDNIKTIIISIMAIVFFVIAGLSFYVKTLNDKLTALETNIKHEHIVEKKEIKSIVLNKPTTLLEKDKIINNLKLKNLVEAKEIKLKEEQAKNEKIAQLKKEKAKKVRLEKERLVKLAQEKKAKEYKLKQMALAELEKKKQVKAEKEKKRLEEKKRISKLKKIKDKKLAKEKAKKKKLAQLKKKEEAKRKAEKEKKRKEKLVKLEKEKRAKALRIKKEKEKKIRLAKEKKRKREKLAKLKKEKLEKKEKARREKARWSLKSKRIKQNNKESLLPKIAKSKLGKRYVWGAVGPSVFDCSGFTSYVYRKSGISIPRTSRQQSRYGKLVDRKHLKPGDLIFFDTSRRRRGVINHVGMYIGNNKFIHASSAKKRVVITSLSNFYSQRFKWARRVIN